MGWFGVGLVDEGATALTAAQDARGDEFLQGPVDGDQGHFERLRQRLGTGYAFPGTEVAPVDRAADGVADELVERSSGLASDGLDSWSFGHEYRIGRLGPVR